MYRKKGDFRRGLIRVTTWEISMLCCTIIRNQNLKKTKSFYCKGKKQLQSIFYLNKFKKHKLRLYTVCTSNEYDI